MPLCLGVCVCLLSLTAPVLVSACVRVSLALPLCLCSASLPLSPHERLGPRTGVKQLSTLVLVIAEEFRSLPLLAEVRAQTPP